MEDQGREKFPLKKEKNHHGSRAICHFYKAQTYSLSINSSGFHQHTEGLHKQDTDGGDLRGDVTVKALSLIVADPPADPVASLKTEKSLLRGSQLLLSGQQQSLLSDHHVYTRMSYSLCHLGRLGGIRAALPASCKNNTVNKQTTHAVSNFNPHRTSDCLHCTLFLFFTL